ncbi:YdcF family protein [Synechococcus sp. RSCCF101]|uniref:YdcF family protein n=1 Tax=Synechococcus sp. RSCCF101 TaxID=2511069 RepID=UPI0012472776|nr:YdcF family protein [Synechococcus sp. RSCCF101]QEY32887.1 YdcF family protein [Synechococcus sp. RSCCF101]
MPLVRRLLLVSLLSVAGVGGIWWVRTGGFAPAPAQLILVLGGDIAREEHAARLARNHRLPVLVSGGSNPEYARWLFRRAGVPHDQLKLDYRARDTLGNFTSVVDELQRARVRHALLVTSTDHMPRALLVGRLVAGSRGIRLSPVPVPCDPDCQPERRLKIWGDGLRAAIWLLSGRDLKALSPRSLHQAWR